MIDYLKEAESCFEKGDFKYDYAQSFCEGLAIVGLNNKWGFIDKTGKVII